MVQTTNQYIYIYISLNIQVSDTSSCLVSCIRMCVYIYIGRTCLVAPMLLLIRMHSVCIQLNTNVIRGLVKRAQLLWHVHNFCETCTTVGKRAQHLWHAHNISEMCTYRILENTGWGRWNTLIYIYTYRYIILYTYCVQVYIWPWFCQPHKFVDRGLPFFK